KFMAFLPGWNLVLVPWQMAQTVGYYWRRADQQASSGSRRALPALQRGATEASSGGADGREIPSFFILESRVVRFSPKRLAAPRGPPMAHPAGCKACRMMARWESMKEVRGAVIGPAGIATGEFANGCVVSGICRGFGSTPS